MLFSFTKTLEPREAEMPPPGTEEAWIHEEGEEDRSGQPWPPHAPKVKLPLSWCYIKQLLTLPFRLLPSLPLSAKSTSGCTKNRLRNPVFAQLQPPTGRAGEHMWGTMALQ